MSVRVIRIAEASWQGTVPEGGGRIALGSGAFEGPFTLRARVEDGERGDQPRGADRAPREAGCFTMSLANLLERGRASRRVICSTTARVAARAESTSGFRITRIELHAVGDVPGVDAAHVRAAGRAGRRRLPVSRALAGTEITLEASRNERLTALEPLTARVRRAPLQAGVGSLTARVIGRNRAPSMTRERRPRSRAALEHRRARVA